MGRKVSVESIAELFTPRNLRATSTIREVLAQCLDMARYYAILIIYLLSRMAFILPSEEQITDEAWVETVLRSPSRVGAEEVHGIQPVQVDRK